MSRSRHTVRDVPPKARRRILRGASGEVRPVWRLLAMAAGYCLATVGIRLGLGALLRALFAAWNLSASTVARAPGWARTLYAWQGSALTLAVDVVAVLFVTSACRVTLRRPNGALGLWWAVGTVVALASAALFLLTDSLRLTWPPDRPHLSPGLAPLWGLSLLTALAEELFTKGALYDHAKRHWGEGVAVCASALAFFLLTGGYAGTWISGINVALMGVLCALLYERCGLWAPVGLRWGWSFATVFLLGSGGGDRSVYRLYGVSEGLLTGSDAGLVYGLWLTGLLAAGILMCRFGKKHRADRA